MSQEAHVLFEINHSIGWITLNRPKALNALSYEMVVEIEKKLQEWKINDDVLLVCLNGSGGKALCAGGDIRALYVENQAHGDAQELARTYLSAEYKMDHLIHTFSKPIVVIMDGFVMGGGVGISIGCSQRLITEKTKWAMPEMNIGFFPDVGASYFLNRMPGYVGRYLALTSETIQAADILYIDAADWYLTSDSLADFLSSLRLQAWQSCSVKETLDELIRSYVGSCPDLSYLQENQNKIDQHFGYDQVEEIMASLEAASLEGCDWAREKLGILQQKSPTSLKVTLEQIIRGKSLSLAECFSMEVELGVQFMRHHDFFEGVRAVLVDKDRNAKWVPSRLEDVTAGEVDGYFPLHKR
ncbi:MAG TPA: enoyl-CoA hydratase/isomerase family protein [Bacillota bacterium]|nr:enoyl-CoA hydratase/isomerase family protein [Bacillota bacterium]